MDLHYNNGTISNGANVGIVGMTSAMDIIWQQYMLVLGGIFSRLILVSVFWLCVELFTLLAGEKKYVYAFCKCYDRFTMDFLKNSSIVEYGIIGNLHWGFLEIVWFYFLFLLIFLHSSMQLDFGHIFVS